MRSLTFVTAVFLAWLAGAGRSPGAILASVPMGGTMVHAIILYDAAAARIDARVEPFVPQLTPLDVPSPADSFSPADPWFACLDPSQRGLAFNRQYGFVMDAASDIVPQGVGIWIRATSRTPGLELYRYRSSAGATSWEPMFGFGGSTNVLLWNLSMFHPAVAAPAENGTHSASFEAFAVDLASGATITAIAAGSFTLNWTNVASARPRLEVARGPILRWPAAATNYVLESAGSHSGPWEVSPDRPVVDNGAFSLALTATNPCQFYRLRRVP